MRTKTTLPISEARKRIFEIAEEVQKPNNYYTLTEKGRPKVVMMSAEEFESWAETLEVMREFPDLDKDVAELERDMRSGKWKEYTTLDEILAREGYIVADKAKKKYVRRSPQTKRRKRTRKNR